MLCVRLNSSLGRKRAWFGRTKSSESRSRSRGGSRCGCAAPTPTPTSSPSRTPPNNPNKIAQPVTSWYTPHTVYTTPKASRTYRPTLPHTQLFLGPYVLHFFSRNPRISYPPPAPYPSYRFSAHIRTLPHLFSQTNPPSSHLRLLCLTHNLSESGQRRRVSSG